MLKYGQEQENVFEIIEKGNFFSPTKGEEPKSAYTEHSPRREKMIRILKWTALAIGVICFVVCGYMLFGSEFS